MIYMDPLRDVLEPSLADFTKFSELARNGEGSERAYDVLLSEIAPDERKRLLDTINSLIQESTFPDARRAIEVGMLIGITIGRKVESYRRDVPNAVSD